VFQVDESVLPDTAVRAARAGESAGYHGSGNGHRFGGGSSRSRGGGGIRGADIGFRLGGQGGLVSEKQLLTSFSTREFAEITLYIAREFKLFMKVYRLTPAMPCAVRFITGTSQRASGLCLGGFQAVTFQFKE